jgi:hypothetical protein
MAYGIDPSLDYDYEDTPRYWASQELEQRIIEKEIENGRE